MEDLSRQELLALKEIHLTGQTSNQMLIQKFVDEGIIVDIEVGDLLLTYKGRSLLVRGSPALWNVAA